MQILSTEQKLKLALMQLKNYSDNELVCVDGNSFNIEDELLNLESVAL